MKHFPVFMDIADRPVLVVGGDDEAVRKVALLLRADAHVRVIAPRLCATLARLYEQNRIEHEARAFCTADLQGARLVVVATDDEVLKREVSKQAMALAIPVNVVDSPQLCSFIMPAIVDRSPIVVAISSAGTSPVLATMLRARIETLLEPGIGKVASWAARWREPVRQVFGDAAARRKFWYRVLGGPIADAVARDDVSQHSFARRSQRGVRWADLQLRAMLQTGHGGQACGSVALMSVVAGHVDLLTMRAARLLHEADVIVHDGIAVCEALEFARRDVVCIDVSRHKNTRHMTDFEICELIAQHSSEGQHVVLLRTGESFEVPDDDRFAQETKRLIASEIIFEVVPGVTGVASEAVRMAPAVAA